MLAHLNAILSRRGMFPSDSTIVAIGAIGKIASSTCAYSGEGDL